MNPQDIQEQIFAQIAHKTKPRKLSAVLGEVLNITASAAYRRISDNTLLSFDQLVILSRHFNIPLDPLMDATAINFRLPSLATKPKNIYEYLAQTEQGLKNLVQSPKRILRYMAVEMPFYYFLSFPHLAAFKFYMWGRTLWHSDRGAFASFNFGEYTQDKVLQSLTERIVAYNNQIATEEIWNDDMLNMTYKQIHYCQNAGLFESDEDVAILLNDLKSLVTHLKSVAKAGQKGGNDTATSIQIWDNEIFQNSMLILTEADEQKMIYTNIDVPNFMVSHDAALYQVSLDFFNRVQSFSNDITSVNEASRRDYFERLHKKTAIYEQGFKHKLVRQNGFAQVS
ncbi:MAG: hypothetical protein JNL70_20015 [Saprospiraceae bacterium]|nr:hypothetical protein [Saprospiraceae bacterium]